MSYQVNGIVDTPDPIRTHIEPTGPFSIGAIADGQSKRVSLGVFKNTGNVNQTVSVAATEFVNCSVENMQFEEGTTKLGTTITLSINEEKQLFATVHAADYSPEDGDQPLSFDIVTVWS